MTYLNHRRLGRPTADHAFFHRYTLDPFFKLLHSPVGQQIVQGWESQSPESCPPHSKGRLCCPFWRPDHCISRGLRDAYNGFWANHTRSIRPHNHHLKLSCSLMHGLPTNFSVLDAVSKEQAAKTARGTAQIPNDSAIASQVGTPRGESFSIQ